MTLKYEANDFLSVTTIPGMLPEAVAKVSQTKFTTWLESQPTAYLNKDDDFDEDDLIIILSKRKWSSDTHKVRLVAMEEIKNET